ncbi:MAG: protein kinase domain-containing protein, partial [Planctomycetota bacterium]
MTSLPSQLGPYAIDREIGRGGMGVVYLGHDTKLDRAVAIKALPEHLAQDPDRLARFEREAKTLAQLNHPNVAGIHGVEEADGSRYLILEYVEGPTLSERLDSGPLPVDEAILICAQIACGLEAAHEAGVIHRDLKPGNVKIGLDGRVKVLDFGLAKTSEGASTTGSSMSQAPTMSTPATPNSPTSPGAILGTAPYMSPEQARGRTLDQRSDIWSFGVVLYECLTGLSPFAGETMSDSIGAILHREPDLSLLPAETPTSIRHLLRRCLERDKAKRLHSIADARIELEDPAQAESEVTAAKGASPFLLAAGAVAILAIGVVGTWLATPFLQEPAQSPMTRRFEFAPEDETSGLPTIAPDGSALVYIDGVRVMIRELAQLEPRVLTSISRLDAVALFWSPDSQWVGLIDVAEIKRIPAAGGEPVTIGVSPRPIFTSVGGACWSDDGRIYFVCGNTPMYVVPAAGGVPREVFPLEKDEEDLHEVSALPDGKGVLFVGHDAAGANTIWLYSESLGRRLLHDEGVRIHDPEYSG